LSFGPLNNCLKCNVCIYPYKMNHIILQFKLRSLQSSLEPDPSMNTKTGPACQASSGRELNKRGNAARTFFVVQFGNAPRNVTCCISVLWAWTCLVMLYSERLQRFHDEQSTWRCCTSTEQC
jgi:hypothetical protein